MGEVHELWHDAYAADSEPQRTIAKIDRDKDRDAVKLRMQQNYIQMMSWGTTTVRAGDGRRVAFPEIMRNK